MKKANPKSAPATKNDDNRSGSISHPSPNNDTAAIDPMAGILIPGGVGLYIGTRNKLHERHGNGWAHLSNGDIYKGSYSNGLRHGYGLYVFKTGERYIGNYRHGLKYGMGTFYYGDGTTYTGEWKSNKRHGHGRYTYTNGDCYEGIWCKGQRHGLGFYIFCPAINGFSKFWGTWVHGVACGPCEIITDNYRLICVWNEEMMGPIGPAVFTFECKWMVIGYFQEVEDAHAFNCSDDKTAEMVAGSASLEIEKSKTSAGSKGSMAPSEGHSDAVPELQLPKFNTEWVCQEIKSYNSADLPQGPDLWAPIIDSDDDEIAPKLPPIRSELFTYLDYQHTVNTKISKNVLQEVVNKTFQQANPMK